MSKPKWWVVIALDLYTSPGIGKGATSVCHHYAVADGPCAPCALVLRKRIVAGSADRGAKAAITDRETRRWNDGQNMHCDLCFMKCIKSRYGCSTLCTLFECWALSSLMLVLRYSKLCNRAPHLNCNQKVTRRTLSQKLPVQVLLGERLAPWHAWVHSLIDVS